MCRVWARNKRKPLASTSTTASTLHCYLSTYCTQSTHAGGEHPGEQKAAMDPPTGSPCLVRFAAQQKLAHDTHTPTTRICKVALHAKAVCDRDELGARMCRLGEGMGMLCADALVLPPHHPALPSLQPGMGIWGKGTGRTHTHAHHHGTSGISDRGVDDDGGTTKVLHFDSRHTDV